MVAFSSVLGKRRSSTYNYACYSEMLTDAAFSS